jgi:hypothetical protein
VGKEKEIQKSFSFFFELLVRLSEVIRPEIA